MSDARETGSMEDGRQPQPVTIDLTRIDIRRGTIHLPRRFLGILPGGERQAEDTVRGEKISVTFDPPRELHGLAEFFAQHELRPNDALTLRISDGQLSLTPIKRERRKPSDQERGRGRYADSPPPAQPEIPEVRREEAGLEQGGFEGIVRERRIDARDRSSYSESGSWQSVLHSPRAPRPPERNEDDSGAGREREGLGAVAERSSRVQGSGEGPRPLDTGRGDPWHLSPRDLSSAERAAPLSPEAQPQRWRHEQTAGGRSPKEGEPEGLVREVKRENPGRGLPLARNEAPQESLFDETARATGATRAEAAAQPAEPAERPAQEEPEEPVPVAVGAQAGQQDAAREVAGYLYSPAAPAIVRATEVAERLGLPADETKRALQQVARNSDGAITAIRQDVYLVKRSS